jgi:hypothetical protein
MWHETVSDWLKRWTGKDAPAEGSESGAKAREAQ